MTVMGFRRLAAIGAVLGLLVGCSSGGATDKADDLAVLVASYDLAAGVPTRFILGLNTVDQRLLGYGTVDLRFSYVGTKDGGADPSPFGPVVKASYLPVHGSTVPSPAPPNPKIVSSSETRGVYGAQTIFDKAGYWEVEATAAVDGKTVSGKGAFAVNPTRAVPGPTCPCRTPSSPPPRRWTTALRPEAFAGACGGWLPGRGHLPEAR